MKNLTSKYTLKPFELFFIILNLSTCRIFTEYASFLPRNSGSSAPFSALFSGIIVFLIVRFLILICEKNNVESILNLLPNKLRIPFFLILFSYLTFSSVSNLMFAGDLIKEIAFPSAPMIFILLIILLGAVVCCSQGFNAISRLHSIIIPLSVFLILPVLLFSLAYGKTDNLFPLYGYGLSTTFSNSIFSMGLYGDIIVLFLLLPFCNKKTYLRKNALFSLASAIVINTSIITVFTLLTPYSVTNTITHPYLELVKLFSAGRFFQRVDGYFLYIFCGCAVLSIATIFFVMSYSAKETFSLPKLRPLPYSFALTTLFSALIICSSENSFIINVFGLLTLFISVIIILTIISVWLILKRRKKL